MRLGDRARSDRSWVEGLEVLGCGRAELLSKQFLHRGGQGRRDTVLQAGELSDHIGRQQVGAGGQNLPKFDEHAARFFERLTDIARERTGFRPCRPPAGQVRR